MVGGSVADAWRHHRRCPASPPGALRGRPAGVSTFFIEAVAKAVKGVVPSPENLAWAEEMRAKGRENHAIATRERWEKRRAKRR